MAPSEYVEIEKDGARIVVTAKAFDAVYSLKDYRIVRRAVTVAEPEEDEDGEDDLADPFDLEVARVTRGNIASILEWVRAGEDTQARQTRCSAVFQREQEGRQRQTLLDALSELSDEIEEESGQQSGDADVPPAPGSLPGPQATEDQAHGAADV